MHKSRSLILAMMAAALAPFALAQSSTSGASSEASASAGSSATAGSTVTGTNENASLNTGAALPGDAAAHARADTIIGNTNPDSTDVNAANHANMSKGKKRGIWSRIFGRDTKSGSSEELGDNTRNASSTGTVNSTSNASVNAKLPASASTTPATTVTETDVTAEVNAADHANMAKGKKRGIKSRVSGEHDARPSSDARIDSDRGAMHNSSRGNHGSAGNSGRSGK